MQVKDVMIHEITLLHPEDRLRDAAQTMKASNLDPLPVWDGCKVVGMLTNSGIQKLALRLGLAAGGSRVSDAMTERLDQCYADQDSTEVLAEVEQQQSSREVSLRGLLVFDRSRRLVGIVSLDDLREGGRRRRSSGPSVNDAAPYSGESVQDCVDYMSAQSYPASDPPPPPSELAPERQES